MWWGSFLWLSLREAHREKPAVDLLSLPNLCASEKDLVMEPACWRKLNTAVSHVVCFDVVPYLSFLCPTFFLFHIELGFRKGLPEVVKR